MQDFELPKAASSVVAIDEIGIAEFDHPLKILILLLRGIPWDINLFEADDRQGNTGVVTTMTFVAVIFHYLKSSFYSRKSTPKKFHCKHFSAAEK